MTRGSFEKIANLLGEGFFADKVVSLKGSIQDLELKRVAGYVSDIRKGRKAVESDGYCDLVELHRLNRFYEWFSLRHGQRKVKTKEEADTIFETTLNNVYLDLKTRLDFFSWLQKKTLNETSRLMYG